MGEVYRVEDLKLGQAVALKFLPKRLAQNSETLARFHKEVRLARKVTHPHVCRVFDIGEAEGLPFLSMEYIDGENLASLLRRIGRLPADKAIEIAQQLCAGLAAIHASGIVHRDLKPANVMIDGKGQARIADFGISAVLTETTETDGSPVVGTPAYMAPEQLTKSVATARSDIYSLGLILYEAFTGQRLLLGETPLEIARLQAEIGSKPPSALVHELDPRIDLALLRCLDRDPAGRPASALELAAMLPGLHPLAAAVAAGKTPSPEMVAAAPKLGSLRPAAGLSCLVGVVLVCACVMAIASKLMLPRQVALDTSTEVLADRARSTLRGLGLTEPPTDVSHGLAVPRAYHTYQKRLYWEGRLEEARNRQAARRSPAILFWYRQSPKPLVPLGLCVTTDDPPRQIPGEAYLELDSQGRLYRLEIVPRVRSDQGTARPPDWAPLFTASGLDLSQFTPDAPVAIPPVYADSNAAWTGSLTQAPYAPVRVRIEAGAFREDPVYFRIIEPWRELEVSRLEWYSDALWDSFFPFVHLAVVFLAWRNLRLGRSDTRGALRLSGFAFFACLAITALAASPLSAGAVGEALLKAALIGICYLSIEPFLRRHWPERITSWSRLIAGNYRDPLVGRDLLIGSLLGSGTTLTLFVLKLVGGWTTGWVIHAIEGGTLKFGSVASLLQNFLTDLLHSLFAALYSLIFFLVMRIILRREAPAVFISWILLTVVLVLGFGGPFAVSIPLTGFASILVVLSWARFGLLAGIVQYLTLTLSYNYGMSMGFSVWYAWVGVFALTTILSLAVYGFITSTAGQTWFRESPLEH